MVRLTVYEYEALEHRTGNRIHGGMRRMQWPPDLSTERDRAKT